MFRGQHQHAIDAKGRTSLPARFREVLATAADSRLMITTALDRYLVAYTMQAWLDFEQQLDAQPQFDKAVTRIRRVYIGGSAECEVDKMGRVLLPQRLRDWAKLDRELLWVGVGKRIEVWQPEAYAAEFDDIVESDEKRAAVEQRLAELGL